VKSFREQLFASVWANRLRSGTQEPGTTDAAEQMMKTALQELRSSLGQEHFFVAVAQNELSDLYMRQGR
jgi:hypothetical protein